MFAWCSSQKIGQANNSIPIVAASSSGFRPMRSDKLPIGIISASSTTMASVLASSAFEGSIRSIRLRYVVK